jgi:hypothetical protein
MIVAPGDRPKILHPDQVPGGDSKPSRLVVVARLILLLAATSAAGATLWMATLQSKSVRPSGARYTCPMHPEAMADAPGECPICHMALELTKPELHSSAKAESVAKEPREGVTAREVTGSQTREAVNYVRFAHFDSVRRRSLFVKIVGPGWYESDRDVVVVLYKDEIAALEKDEHASFFVSSAPQIGHEVRVTTDSPVPWDRSTSRVHFRLERDVSSLNPGEPGWVELTAKPREALVVPSTAILESPEGPYVLTGSIADHKFARRPVEIGEVFSGMTTVVSGLGERDMIVAMNAFFIDAEWRLRTGFELASEVNP